MTPGERAVWIAVYAAHVHSPRSTTLGHVTRDQVALIAATEATIAVDRLRALVDLGEPGNPVSDQAREVLR